MNRRTFIKTTGIVVFGAPVPKLPAQEKSDGEPLRFISMSQIRPKVGQKVIIIKQIDNRLSIYKCLIKSYKADTFVEVVMDEEIKVCGNELRGKARRQRKGLVIGFHIVNNDKINTIWAPQK